MEEEAAVAASMRKIGITDLFKGEYAWPMFLAIMMMCGQQLSGINVAMFFSTKIFSDAGLGEGALYATLGMGAVNVAMTLISVYLVSFSIYKFKNLFLNLNFCHNWVIKIFDWNKNVDKNLKKI